MRQKNLSKRLIILLSIILFSSFSLHLTNLVVQVDNTESTDIEIEEEVLNVKSSGFWSVPYIHINNDNWSASALAWIQNRTGTWDDPHVIENVTTTSSTSGGHGIYIQSSSEHFIIKNCTTSTSGVNSDDYGILLFLSSNGKIYNNSISGNAGSGLGLSNGCNNLTIYDNRFVGNTIRGMFISGGYDLNISENEVRSNGERGIYMISGCYDILYDNNEILGQITQSHGISMTSNCRDINITRNTISDHTFDGILIDNNSYNNTIYDNDITGTGTYGIEINGLSDDNKIIMNTLDDNGIRGILLQNSDNTIIKDNTMDGTGIQSNGMVIYNGADYTEIINNTIENCQNDGLLLWQSVTNTKVINNTIFNHGNHGIRMYANNGPVSNNYIFNNTIHDNTFHGIYLNEGTEGGDYNEIYENTIYTNNQHGIFFESPSIGVGHMHNRIINNTIYDSQFVAILIRRNSFNTTIVGNDLLGLGNNGIQIETESDNSTIVDNYLIDHFVNGISVIDCNYTIVINNTVINCLQDGLTLTTIFNCTVDNNTLIDNKGYGIKLNNAGQDNNITDNDIINNNKTGLYITDNCDYNLIYMNTIYNNTDYGLLIDVNDCQNNLIYLNNFTDNGIHAYDNSTNNYWDNGTTGNIWDNYTGKDIDDNNRGDTPYNISGNGLSQDNHPIWWDGPVISISSPLFNDPFDYDELPTYTVSMDEGVYDTIWYTILGTGLNITTTTLTGTINQTLWNLASTGSITLRFWANDSRGNVASADQTILRNPESTNGNGGPPPGGIPFGSYYLIILLFSVIGLVIIDKKRKSI